MHPKFHASSSFVTSIFLQYLANAVRACWGVIASGARDCGAPEWQDESVPTDADDGESSTVGDDVARHIGDNKGIRRERAIDIDVDPADSTDVDVITSAATALSLDDTVENRTEDLAEAIGRITLGPDPAPTPRGGGTRPCRAPLAAPGRGTPWKRASSPVSRTPLADAADQFRERSSAGGVRFLP
ncbi:hypothetical protein EMIHUDRAFT_218117 [Emiliania huxleyi CCMP1516]|uniref:Uncharacterized protein n=2 Tax=Emiliania huxleyi TaxID=2903 RepID=A0A0D3I8Q0_EMIH1|nr:hypothetical protein EMIHUDRAFT_218117 [Emiliania huxleyi CCMP1516]EOD07635.1 hypothetical protein EMIHUDRAFT_218117 [Emiliania huxleyi CCMP1516]|eukprot:XP_005760064.1 hypothetical protein EMIHUDRAFT_218117 [Emiliania huxleyi CCMP1516]